MKTSLGPWLAGAAALLLAGGAQAALDIYADFDADKLHDAGVSVAPGAALTMGVYALEDGAHGGLTSYGVEMMLASPLAIAGATDAARLASIVSDSQWEFPETKSVSPAIEVIDLSFIGAYTGKVHLFDVTLRAPAVAGMYTVSFKNVEPDASFDGFVGFDGFVYDPSNSFKSSVVTVVPEPTGAELMALGIAALGGLRLLRRRPAAGA